jgi:dynein heavy chain, axonemal
MLDEKIPLYKDVIVKGQVEEWLNEFLRTHQKTIHQCVRRSIERMSYEEFDLHTFLEREIVQLALLIVQVVWTQRSERALRDALFNRTVMSETNRFFLDVLNQLIEKTTRKRCGLVRRSSQSFR